MSNNLDNFKIILKGVVAMDCEEKLTGKELRVSFSFGAVLGLIVFCSIYGVRILDVQYDAWLLNGGDLTQHYLGWCLFRDSSWMFPIGVTSAYAWPCAVSIMYADAIPLCAIFFKIFSPLLPETFQYLGIWGLFCYILQGGFAAILLRRFIPSAWISGMLSLFFLVGSQIMFRMFEHTALGTQWILLLSLVLLFYRGYIQKPRFWKLIWGGMGALCVWVHGYFVPMVFLVMLTCIYLHWWRQGNRKECVLLMGCYLFGVVASMIVLGAFSVRFTTANSAELSMYVTNLDAFFNPIFPQISRFVPPQPLLPGQYEGYSYLGLGGMFLVLIASIKKGRELLREKSVSRDDVPLIYLWLICMFLAILPKVCFHDTVLLELEYPSSFANVLAIFRTHGRFVWIPAYLLMLFAIVTVSRIGQKKKICREVKQGAQSFFPVLFHKEGMLTVLFLLMVQLADFSSFLGLKYHNYHEMVLCETETGRRMLKGYDAIGDIMKDYEHVVYTDYLYALHHIDVGQMIAYYAYKNDVKLEVFYLARMPEQHLRQMQDKIRHELEAGNPRNDTLYVMTDPETAKGYKNLFYQEVNGLLLGSKVPFSASRQR